MFALAHNRANQFSTQKKISDTKHEAMVNAHVRSRIEEMRDYLKGRWCANATALIDPIVAQMTVPLLQGTIRYAYHGDSLAQANFMAKKDLKKERAEGWAFLAAVLPQIDNCDHSVAEMLKANMMYGVKEPMSAGYEEVVRQLQSVYGCLDVTCADVGGYTDPKNTQNPVHGLRDCSPL